MRLGLRRACDGATTVELALALPVVLLLLVGVVELAAGLNAYVTVANASREGAQYAILHPTAAPAEITDAVIGRSVPLHPDRLSVNAYYWDGSTFQPWPSTGVPASSPTAQLIPVRVEVSYSWSAVTFVVGTFIGGGTGTRTFSSSSTMRMRR